MPTTSVQAQSCHAPAPLASRGLGLRAFSMASFASYKTPRYVGDYRAVRAGLSYSFNRYSLRVSLPYYWLTRNGLDSQGIGDLQIDPRVRLLQSKDQTWSAGITLNTTLPTGDAHDQLGMGHVMPMPGFWLLVAQDQWFGQAQFAYGKALAKAGGSHHHAGGPAPLVQPMNASEIDASLAIGRNYGEYLRFRGGAYGAVAVHDDAGQARLVGFGATDLILGGFDVGLEVHLAAIGTPFIAKGVLVVGQRF